MTDYRDPKVPGFVLRARPSGVHSWRVQLPNRRWLTLGRLDEVTLGDAREEAQQRRAKAALGVDIATRRPKSEISLAQFLDDQYEPWMKATRRGHSTQVDRIRWAFKEFLDDQLADITTGRVERSRAGPIREPLQFPLSEADARAVSVDMIRARSRQGQGDTFRP